MIANSAGFLRAARPRDVIALRRTPRFATSPRMRIAAMLTFLLIAACDRTVLTTVRPPRLPMVDLEARPEAPAAIAIRYALVRYAGAEGASDEVVRSKEDAEVRARMVAGLARQPGQSFREVQTGYGEGPTGQLVLPRDNARIPSNVVEAAFALNVGERSNPIEAPEGYFIVAREEDPQLGPTQVYARHVLVSFAEARNAVEGVTRTRAEARTLIEQVLTEATADPTRFEELAAEYSDEPGAAESGGDLGGITRGQMVPPFERAVFALEVGQISPVVETAFGYHVILRYR